MLTSFKMKTVLFCVCGHELMCDSDDNGTIDGEGLTLHSNYCDNFLYGMTVKL